jgi:DNA-binding response OmpR family regulator
MHERAAMTGKRILAVENDELVRRFLEDGLVMAGYDVDTASNGREALQKIDQGDYDLIICDVRMPELDGPGLYRALGERGDDTLAHLLFLTTPDALDAHEALLAQIGLPVLIKPIELDDLHSVVGRMIDHVAEAVPV